MTVDGMEVNAIWDETHLKALLQLSHSPLYLIQASPWADWIRQRGGLQAVGDYLLNLEDLAADQRDWLRLILAHPQQTADFYAAERHVSRKTYFRALHKLLPILEQRLNAWLPTPTQPTFHAPASNLPAPMTRFIGRDQELKQVKHLLANSRLLTLTGPGGIGKTRLALQAAADLLDVFSDGVWLVELAGFSDPSLVPQAVATALGVPESADCPLAETLTDYLGAKKDILLLLDNCEHLLEACAKLVNTWLRACPDLRLLAISREAFGLAAEVSWRVPALSLPDPETPPAFETLTQFEAVQLFVERARAALPSFTLTSQNASAIIQICQRLDGMPLALELAAARVKMLKIEQIAARLDDSFQLLTGGSRTALPRQQSLRALIDWSYELLSESERALLRRLSVFVGGWTSAAAEQVAGSEWPGVDDSAAPHPASLRSGNYSLPLAISNVPDLLTQLVNKSLVEQELGPEARYRLLETIRQYAQEKLQQAGETQAVRDRHLQFCLKLVSAVEPKLQGAEVLTWLKRLEVEQDNLRAALEWSLANGATRTEEGLQLAGALDRISR